MLPHRMVVRIKHANMSKVLRIVPGIYSVVILLLL